MAKLAQKIAVRLGRDLGLALNEALDTLYALTSLASASIYQTSGGEPGDAAGFGGGILCRLKSSAAVSVTRTLISRYATSPSNSGFYCFTTGLHADVRFDAVNAAGAFVSLTHVGPQRDRIVLLVYQHTGAGNQQRLWISPDQVVTGAITGYATPNPATHYIGRATFGAGSPATDTDILAHATWRGVPNEAAVRDYYLRARVLGDLPTTITGGTSVRKWPERGLLKPNVAPPATMPEAVTGATADVMTKVGSPTVSTIDAAAPKAWSYEASPILSGAQAFGVNDHLTHPDALRASTSDWHFLLLWRLLSQDTSFGAASRVLLGDGVAGAGYLCYTSGFNSSLILSGTSAAGANVNAPVVTLSAADVGKLHLTAGVFDATAGRLRLYHKRVEQGTASVISGFLPGSSASYVGRSLAGQPASGGVAVLGWGIGHALLTLSEYQAACDAAVAKEEIVGVPGKTQGLWSLTQDRIDLSATIADRIGSKHFSRVGQPALASVYSRAWSW